MNYEIKRKSEVGKSFEFCLKAMGKKDTRYALMYLKVEKNKIYCTDGHRLHIADLTGKIELSDGIYDVKKSPSKFNLFSVTDVNFPNVHKVIPSKEDYTANTPINHSISSEPGIKAATLLNVIHEKTGALVNVDYLKDITSVAEWVLHHYGNKPLSPVLLEISPVLLENSHHTAVIMPFRQ